MSIKVMSAIWECDGLDASERLVLLSLADHADDGGRCYPSVARLCKRTSMSDRGVQKVLARLMARGFVRVSMNAGQGGANVYTVTATPEPGSPPNDVHPRTTFTPPPNPVRPTPEPGSPKPSGTINEPSIEAAPKSRRRPEVPIPRNWIPNAKNIADAEARQFSAQEVKHEAERFRDHHLARDTRFRDWDAAWRTWLGNARRFAKPIPEGGKRPDPALEQIARLAGLGATSGDGRGGTGGLGEEAGPLWMGTRPQ